MGELERYGLLSAALLLLMAGLLAFFGRDSGDDRPGASVLSANPSTLDRDAGPRSGRDPGSAPKPVNPAPEVEPKPVPTTPANENEGTNGDDAEVRPRLPAVGTKPDVVVPPESKTETKPDDAGSKLPAVEGPIHYKVKAGDTLSSIAKTHFGDKKYYPLIESANPGLNPNSLKVDQELILPAKGVIGDAGTKPAVTPATNVEKPRETKPKTVAPPKSVAPLKSGKSAPAVEPVAPVKGKAAGVTSKEAALAAADKPVALVESAKTKQPATDEKTARKDKKDAGKVVDKKGVREHRVTKGDTLTSIARHYYDDSNKWKVIFEANRDKLKSTSLVPEGVVLKIP